MKHNSINFLVVDDHPLVCRAISLILTSNKYTKTIDIAGDAESAANKIKNDNNINFLILDIDLKTSDGFDLFRRLSEHGYDGYTLFISSNDNRLMHETAFSLGGHGFVSKSKDINSIEKAINNILDGFLSFRQDIIRNKRIKDKPVMSPREMIVYNYLTLGHSNKEIANILNLSPKTISTYKTRILKKFSVKTTVELITMDINYM